MPPGFRPITAFAGSCLALSICWLVAFAPTDALAGSFHDGIAAYRAGHYAEARRVWTGLGRKGNGLAQYNLGIMYLGGKGIGKDHRLARKWFERAANNGFAPAFVNLAGLFRNGHGTKRNKKFALAHLIVASSTLLPGKCRTVASTQRNAISDALSAKEVLLATRMANEILRSGESKLSFYSFGGRCFDSIALAGAAFGQIAQISGFRVPVLKEPAPKPAGRSVASDVAVRDKVPAGKNQIASAPSRRMYFAQVGSLPTDAAAQRFQSKLRQRHAQALGEHQIIVQEAEVKRLGTVYRVRVGPFGDKSVAKNVCRAMREKHQDCFVIRQAKSAG